MASGVGGPTSSAPVVDMIEQRLATLQPDVAIAIVWAIIPPIDVPTTCARSIPSASKQARRCRRPYRPACRPRRRDKPDRLAAAHAKAGPTPMWWTAPRRGCRSAAARSPALQDLAELVVPGDELASREPATRIRIGSSGAPRPLVAELDPSQLERAPWRGCWTAGRWGSNRSCHAGASMCRCDLPTRARLRGAGTQPGAGEPHRRPHRLQRGSGPAHGRRPGDDGDVRSRRGIRSSAVRRASPSRPTSTSVPLDPEILRQASSHLGAVRRRHGRRVHPTSGRRGRCTPRSPSARDSPRAPRSEVAVALALGFEAEPLTLARICQHAEQAATGVPTGIMDQLVVSAAREGQRPADRLRRPVVRSRVGIPEGAEVVVVHSGETGPRPHSAYARAPGRVRGRRLSGSGRSVGSGPRPCSAIPDALLRRRARHVVTECDRVRWFTGALGSGRPGRGRSAHVGEPPQPRRDFEVSTPGLDSLVDHLAGTGGRLRGTADRGRVRRMRSGAHRSGALDLEPLPADAGLAGARGRTRRRSGPSWTEPRPTRELMRRRHSETGASSSAFLDANSASVTIPRRRSSSSCTRRVSDRRPRHAGIRTHRGRCPRAACHR